MAKHWVKEGGQDIPLCDDHYEEWLTEKELTIDSKLEELDGDLLQGC